jgi:hypothetical protein
LVLTPLAFAAESDVKDLKQELKALRKEVKTLKEEIRVYKEKASEEAGLAEPAVTQDELQGVRAEVETLRDQWQRTIIGDYGADTKVPVTSRSLTLGGIVQTGGIYTEDKSAKSGFTLSALILSFRGSLRRDYEEGRNLNYSFSLSSDTTDSYRVKPLDAFISYSVLPSLNIEQPYLFFTLGQQKKPFGLDPQATEEKKPTIRSAQFDSKLGLGARDMGVVVRGDLFPFVDYGFSYRVPLLEYSLGLINGSGANRSDDNSKKDLVGRIILNAVSDYNSVWRGFSLGISYYTGTKDVTLGTGATAITRQGVKNRSGIDLSYVQTPIGFTVEYAQGKDVAISGTAANPVLSNVESQGYIGTLFYNFGQQFVRGFKAQTRYDDWYPLTHQLFVRFDRWDPNQAVSGDRTDIYTLGFNWFFAETTKLQVNYNIKTEESNEINNNDLLAQFQYGF